MKERIEAFVNHLIRLAEREDRAALAALRRSLAFSPGTYPPSFPYVEPWTGGLSDAARQAYYLGAGLFALNRRHAEGKTVAEALAREMKQRDSKSVEGRFLALLDAEEDELGYKLRQAVFLLGEQPLDWVQLIYDIAHWSSDNRWVQVRWAKEFYGVSDSEAVKQEEKEEIA